MTHYGIEDGLPSNTVYSIYRDSKGFLWIATDKGVARYNGIRFEKFTTFNGLADNEVFFFQEDLFGRIWLASYNGQLCYYKDGLFHNAQNTPFLKLKTKSSYITSINIEFDSTITIHYSVSPVFINIRENAIREHNISNYNNDKVISTITSADCKGGESSFYRNIKSIKKLPEGGYNVICFNNIVKINDNDNIVNIVPSPFVSVVIHVFSQDSEFFINNFCIYDRVYNLIKKTSMPFYVNQHIYSLRNVYRNPDNIFIITSFGLYMSDSILMWANPNISSLTQDNSGKFWVGTLDKGIYDIGYINSGNKYYSKAYNDPIKYAKYKNDSLYYATNNCLYGLANNSIYSLLRFNLLSNKNDSIQMYNPGYFLDDQGKFYMFYNQKNEIVDLKTKQSVQRYNTFGVISSVKNILSINKNLYLFNIYYIYRIIYENLKANENVFRSAVSFGNGERIFCSAKDMNNEIWYTTFKNTFKIINDMVINVPAFSNIHFKSFEFSGSYMVGFSHDNIMYICNNYNGNVMIDSFIIKNTIWDKIYEIDSEHLLLSTNDYYRIITLFPSSGKPEYSIRTIENSSIPLNAEYICCNEKKCFFFKNGSITTANSSSLFRSSPVPSVYFNFISSGHKNYKMEQELELPFNDSRNLTISFSVVSFSGTNLSSQYSISKDGIDYWNNIQAEAIDLINPEYGDYIIKLRAKTLSSDYSAPIFFTLHISRPYWATWWFIGLGTLVAGGVVALIVRARIKTIIVKREREHERKVRFMRSEYKALNALMNPHFIFNTLNNVQSLFNGDNKKAANEYLRIFADLIRQNMHNVSKELITLQKEMDLVTNYLLLEKLRFEEKLQYEIIIEEHLELYEIMVPPLLIQPLVENSIKHGILPMEYGGIIKVDISERNGLLTVVIKDNGAGLNNAKAKAGSLHESFGLDNIRKRIEQLSIIQDKQMTFSMASVTDGAVVPWTTVTITMPLS